MTRRREFWEQLEKAAAEVAKWPAWKQRLAGMKVASDESSSSERHAPAERPTIRERDREA